NKEIEEILSIGTDKYKSISLEIDRKQKTMTATYVIEGTKEKINKIPKKLFERDWFEYCKVE
ncbi:MAG: hypothetical protein N3D84_03155, partial [Candidatus Woesearchaeota archaeon]|nr:hypothetical protein [Candidatus Woesearchaeota archaeon]